MISFDHQFEKREFARGLYIRVRCSFRTGTQAHRDNIKGRTCLQPLFGPEIIKKANVFVGGRNSSWTRVFQDNNLTFKEGLFALKGLLEQTPDQSDSDWTDVKYNRFYPKAVSATSGNTAGADMTVALNSSVDASNAAYNLDNTTGDNNYDYTALVDEVTAQSSDYDDKFYAIIPFATFGLELDPRLGHNLMFLPLLRWQIEIYPEHPKRACLQTVTIDTSSPVDFTANATTEVKIHEAALFATEVVTLTPQKWEEFENLWENEEVNLMQLTQSGTTRPIITNVTKQEFNNLGTEPFQFMILTHQLTANAVDGAALAEPFRYHYIRPHLTLAKTEVTRGSDAGTIERKWDFGEHWCENNYRSNFINVFGEELREKVNPYIQLSHICNSKC